MKKHIKLYFFYKNIGTHKTARFDWLNRLSLRYSVLSIRTQHVQLYIVKNCDWPFPDLTVHIKSVQQNLHSWQWALSRLEPYIFWSFRNLLLFSIVDFRNCQTQLLNNLLCITINFQITKLKHIVIYVFTTIYKKWTYYSPQTAFSSHIFVTLCRWHTVRVDP